MSRKPKKAATDASDDTSNAKAIDSVLADLQGKYGAKSVTKGNVPPIEKISFDLWPLDSLTGGGISRRRWTQFFGPKSSGKSTLCLLLAAKVQKSGGIVGYCDAEHCLDVEYAKALGVNPDKDFIYARPHSLEESETFVQKLAPHVDLLIVDSIVAVGGAKELRAIEEKGLEKDSMMVIPLALSKFFRVVTPIIGKGRAAIVLVNQQRTNVGGYISFDDFSGGNALRHANSLSLYMRPGPKADNPKIKVDKKEIDAGQNTVVKIDKNKTGGSPMGHSAVFNIWHTKPYIRPLHDLISNAVSHGIITRSGPTYSLEGTQLAVGRDNILAKLEEDKGLQKMLKEKMQGVVA